jgi:hypothetical protein
VVKRDKESEKLAELRESIKAGLAKSRRLVARSRELFGAAAQGEGEPPAIKTEPNAPNRSRR